jgi:hypothetical protein
MYRTLDWELPCLSIGGVEHAQEVDAFRMRKREVDRGKPGRIMRDRDELTKAQGIHDRFEVTELLFKTVGSAGGFVGRTKAQEIEGDDPTATSYQIRNQIVLDVQVIGEAVHKHKGGTSAFVVACIDSSLSRGT